MGMDGLDSIGIGVMVDPIMIMAVVMLVCSLTLFIVIFVNDIFINEEMTTRVAVSALFAFMSFMNILVVGQNIVGH
jgi:hypothetical protein